MAKKKFGLDKQLSPYLRFWSIGMTEIKAKFILRNFFGNCNQTLNQFSTSHLKEKKLKAEMFVL